MPQQGQPVPPSSADQQAQAAQAYQQAVAAQAMQAQNAQQTMGQQQPQDSAPKTYNPQGAMGGTFAPIYIPGYKPSEQALTAWQSGRGLTPDQVASTAMPPAWSPPSQTSMFGGGQYGPNLAGGTFSFTSPQGNVDPMALRAMAQDLPYDMQGRRDAIAAQLASNANAQSAYNASQAANNWWMYGASA